mmetsp:Transcript_13493/g.46670  ORF Transcript_13493/g.46670 Transcript_13493/m.46670 type:complete len:346 (-) Transcript_13493:2089-3126(-)
MPQPRPSARSLWRRRSCPRPQTRPRQRGARPGRVRRPRKWTRRRSKARKGQQVQGRALTPRAPRGTGQGRTGCARATLRGPGERAGCAVRAAAAGLRLREPRERPVRGAARGRAREGAPGAQVGAAAHCRVQRAPGGAGPAHVEREGGADGRGAAPPADGRGRAQPGGGRRARCERLGVVRRQRHWAADSCGPPRGEAQLRGVGGGAPRGGREARRAGLRRVGSTPGAGRARRQRRGGGGAAPSGDEPATANGPVGPAGRQGRRAARAASRRGASRGPAEGRPTRACHANPARAVGSSGGCTEAGGGDGPCAGSRATCVGPRAQRRGAGARASSSDGSRPHVTGV